MAHQNSIAESESCGEAQVAVALINLAAAAHLVSSANTLHVTLGHVPRPCGRIGRGD